MASGEKKIDYLKLKLGVKNGPQMYNTTVPPFQNLPSKKVAFGKQKSHTVSFVVDNSPIIIKGHTIIKINAVITRVGTVFHSIFDRISYPPTACYSKPIAAIDAEIISIADSKKIIVQLPDDMPKYIKVLHYLNGDGKSTLWFTCENWREQEYWCDHFTKEIVSRIKNRS